MNQHYVCGVPSTCQAVACQAQHTELLSGRKSFWAVSKGWGSVREGRVCMDVRGEARDQRNGRKTLRGQGQTERQRSNGRGQWSQSPARRRLDASGETQTQRDPHRGTETRKERDRNSQGEVIGEIQTGGVTESCGATETARDRDPHEETATRTQRETGTHKENHRPSGSPADGDATASGS